MLERLIINNIAIIKDIDISFKEGMNVISGDTGAGKSLVIDSLLLLSGNRAISSLIRHNEKKAYVKAIFKNISKEGIKYLNSLNIFNTDKIEIIRELSLQRNLIKVNDVAINLVELKELAKLLFSVHEQQDTFRLFNEENYFTFIDNDDVILDAINNYLFAYNDYKEVLNKYNDLENNKKANADKLDFLLYEKKELEELNLIKDEDLKLEKEIAILKNYDLLFNSLRNTYNLLEDKGTCDNLYEGLNNMAKISDIDNKYKNIYNILNDSYYNLADLKSTLYNEIMNFNYDKDELNNLQQRLYDIEKIKEKYHKSVNEIIDYYNNITYEIEKICNYDELLNKIKIELNKAREKLNKIGLKLHDLRKRKALSLQSEVILNASQLELNNVSFKIDFKEIIPNVYYENGLDKIEFLVSFNKGEPLKELTKVASGGEMSRLMLAFKAIEAKTKNYSLMVFDEIDTGVSGEAAKKIANKIKEISKNTQVICITHIAIVAASSDHEYLIYKEEKNEETYAYIKELSMDERVKVIAKMIAGNSITSGAILSAKELLGLN